MPTEKSQKLFIRDNKLVHIMYKEVHSHYNKNANLKQY